MQHLVEPFRLKDPSQPGQRTIFAFFLVDPTVPVLSTQEVPYQNHGWLERLLLHCIAHASIRGIVPYIADEIVRKITNMVAGVFTRDEADRYRLELMDIRKSGAHLGDQFEAECSLCEH